MTTRVSTCRYCGRTLPIEAFPVKPGYARARYKECAECHELGHSCIPKEKPKRKRRTFATEEERQAAKKEYQRRYYWTRRGLEPPEPKAKQTPEERKASQREAMRKWNENNVEKRRAYQRRRYHENPGKFIAKSAEYSRRHRKEIAKAYAEKRDEARKEAADTGRFYCSVCKRILTAEAFTADGRQYKVCNTCREKERRKRKERGETPPENRQPKSPHGTGSRYDYHRQYYAEHHNEMKVQQVSRRSKPDPVPDKVCDKCWLHPCFEGMENISSNLALTCQKFHEKEAAP